LPTATFVLMWLLLSLAVANNWPVHTFDFVAAYLNSPIDEEVWVAQPEGLKMERGQGCLLKKALYGTRHAARCWWQHLSKTLHSLGYSSSQCNGSVYMLKSKEGNHIIWIHVDNSIITAPSTEILQQLERTLSKSIEIKLSESLLDMVGLKVEREGWGFCLSQPRLISSILREHWNGVRDGCVPSLTCRQKGSRQGQYLGENSRTNRWG
jgi:hypothetical protein